MGAVDIVELLQRNPITKLSDTSQSKLLVKVKNKFTNYEQQMFLASFYCYLNFKNNEFVVDLDNIWKWVGFKQKVNAKVLLEKHFNVGIDYTLSHFQDTNQVNKNGGNNKETFMLTVKTFKSFCLKADTSKSNDIHNYYIVLEEMLIESTNEESDELRVLLEAEKEQKTHFMELSETQKISHSIDLIRTKEIERQTILLSEFGTKGPLVYIIKVKSYENGEYIVKIGESRCGVTGRFNEHKTNYEEVLLLDCFSVNRSKDFEKFIHGHDKIRSNRVSDLKGHETERELFLIGKNLTYKTLIHLIANNIKTFDENSEENARIYKELYDAKMEIHNLKLQINNDNTSDNNSTSNTGQLLDIISNMQKTINDMQKTIDKSQKTIEEILEKINTIQPRTTTNFNTPLVTLGPRLQKINPETFQLIKVYETVTECMNENNSIKRPSINKAVEENTIYCGFRWMLVDRELDATIVSNIEPTKETRSQNLGYIAKLNAEKTEILNVYLDRKTAATLNGYDAASALDLPVKRFTITNGHYYILYESCEDALKYAFVVVNGGYPILYKNGIGKYDGDMNLIQEFVCKYDCIKTLQMSDKTLAKALDKNIMYGGYYYRYMDSRLQCLS